MGNEHPNRFSSRTWTILSPLMVFMASSSVIINLQDQPLRLRGYRRMCLWRSSALQGRFCDAQLQSDANVPLACRKLGR